MRIKSIVASMLIGMLFLSGGVAGDEPQKKVMNYLAVMDLNCGTALNKEGCTALTNVVIAEIVKIGKYKVVDRANRDKILSEAGFQQTGCVDESCTIEMGRVMGVGKMVVGSLTKLGGTYLINLQLLNVETATVEVTSDEECKCDIDTLIGSVRNAARKLMGQSTTTQPQPPQPKPTPSPQPAAPKLGEMVKVPAGEFMMGNDSGDANEKPAHKVYLDEFFIDKYEVTNEQYNQCVNAGLCSPNEKIDGLTFSQQPVIVYDWNMAETFCSWAGRRLPTEAEWEKAARGTEGRTYPWGEGVDCSKANYLECKLYSTKNVGSYPSGASPYGAMDMAGNVWEWTADWYDANYYKSSPDRNPTGPDSGKSRVLRGGSGNNTANSVRTSTRYWERTRIRYYFVGFRCAKTP